MSSIIGIRKKREKESLGEVQLPATYQAVTITCPELMEELPTN